jgi:hypothetical protein
MEQELKRGAHRAFFTGAAPIISDADKTPAVHAVEEFIPVLCTLVV